MIPTQSYVICTTSRSGGTLLCDLLTDTGVAGRHDSYFRRQSRTWWADYLNVTTALWDNTDEFDQAYLSAVLREGCGGTTTFGMRLMWESLDDLSERFDSLYPGLPSDHARFQSAFGPTRYVHLSREDKVAQAVSRLRAEQSGLWHVNADGTERERMQSGQTPDYDFHELSIIVEELEKHDAAWAGWFGRQDIHPVHVTYETLADSPSSTLTAVLSALDIDPAIARTVVPRTAKLADRDNLAWAARFRADCGLPPA